MSFQVVLPILIILFTLAFIAREYLTFKKILPAKYSLTPFITLMVCLVALASVGESGLSDYRALVIASLLFALAADTMLMVVEVDLLKYGLIYFLTGHVFYSAAFSLDYFFKPWNIALAVVIIAVMVLYSNRLKKKTGNLFIPVLIYLLIISVMLFFAISGLNYGLGRQKVFIAAGAVLFVASDTVLAYNAFLRKLEHSTVITWSMYGPAQLLIALSCFD